MINHAHPVPPSLQGRAQEIPARLEALVQRGLADASVGRDAIEVEPCPADGGVQLNGRVEDPPFEPRIARSSGSCDATA